MLQWFCRSWIGTDLKASWIHPAIWHLLCSLFSPLSPKDHYETMPQTLPKCESLWEVTKTGSEGSLGAVLRKIWKLLALLLREINTLFASVFGMSLCNGLVTALHPGKELAEQHGGNKEEKPRRGKRTWGFFFFKLYFILVFKVRFSRIKMCNYVRQHVTLWWTLYNV